MNFSGPVTLPGGSTMRFHRITRLVVDLTERRFFMDLTSWPTRESHDARFAGEQHLTYVDFAAVAGASGVLAEIRSALTAPGGPLSGATEALDDGTLEEAKRKKRVELLAAWRVDLGGGIDLGGGKIAPTDAASWTRYLALARMADDAGWIDVPIPLADDTFELLTKAKAALLWEALKAHERTLLAKLRDKIEQVNNPATDTIAAVAAIVWD